MTFKNPMDTSQSWVKQKCQLIKILSRLIATRTVSAIKKTCHKTQLETKKNRDNKISILPRAGGIYSYGYVNPLMMLM